MANVASFYWVFVSNFCKQLLVTGVMTTVAFSNDSVAPRNQYLLYVLASGTGDLLGRPYLGYLSNCGIADKFAIRKPWILSLLNVFYCDLYGVCRLVPFRVSISCLYRCCRTFAQQFSDGDSLRQHFPICRWRYECCRKEVLSSIPDRGVMGGKSGCCTNQFERRVSVTRTLWVHFWRRCLFYKIVHCVGSVCILCPLANCSAMKLSRKRKVKQSP